MQTERLHTSKQSCLHRWGYRGLRFPKGRGRGSSDRKQSPQVRQRIAVALRVSACQASSSSKGPSGFCFFPPFCSKRRLRLR